MSTTSPELETLLGALCDANVEFLVVGAYALRAHGIMRETADLDVWVRPSDWNAQRLEKALMAFGAHLRRAGTPSPLDVDILTAIDGVRFDAAWERRFLQRIGTHDVPIIGRADLIANKLATGRDADWADAVALGRAPEGPPP